MHLPCWPTRRVHRHALGRVARDQVERDDMRRWQTIFVLLATGLIPGPAESPAQSGPAYYVCFTGGTGACTSRASCTVLTSTDCSDACTAANNAQFGGGTVGPWCNLPGTRNATNTVIVGPAVTIAGGSTINIKLGTVKTGGDGYVLIDANRYAPGTEGAPTVIRGLSGWGTGPVAIIDGVGMTVPAFSGLITNNRIPWLQFEI